MSARLSVSAIAAVGVSLLLAACGGDSNSGNASAANNGPQGRGAFAALTTKQRECLKAEGVTLPTFSNRQGPPPNGAAPPANGQGPPTATNGQPPAGARRFNGNSAQAKKMQAAFKKCGITLPTPGQGFQTQTNPGN
jgi:hypothetical protein